MLGSLIKHKKLVVGAIFVLVLSFSWLTVGQPSVYAQPNPNPTPANPTAPTSNADTASSDSDKDDDDTTCAIEKMGWVLCPLIETASRIGDQAFEQLADHFLETEPELVAGGSKSGTYTAWELARNIANIMFIIAFLFIIFSQVTGQGINNYGIKRLMPKLIIAAIAVNASYYICQAMVDLTNILGYEIKDFMVERAKQVSEHHVAMPPQSGVDIETGNGTLGAIAIGVLGVAAVVWFLLPMLFLGVTTILIACLVIIVILLMRKAFIVLLVVISPLAFVMYLLPNTEKLFQKWLRMFWQLLLVFPIVGLLFGGGQLASAIILVAGASSSEAYADKGDKCIQLPEWPPEDASQKGPQHSAQVKDCGDNSTPFMLGLVAAGIAVAPLFAVWSVLKGALSAAGAIGGKISGAVQNAGNRAGKRAGDLEKKFVRKPMAQGIATGALNGGFGKRTAGFVRRRQLAGKRREARLAAAQEGFDATGGEDIAMDTLAARQAGNAAQKALRDKFIQEQLDNPNLIGNNLGVASGDKAIGNALVIQQTQARAEAQRDIEARLDPADLKGLGDQLQSAYVAADQVEVRALTSALLKAGAGGQNEFRRATAHAIDHGNATPEMAEAVRQEIQGSFPGYKDKDWALGNWGEGTGAKGLEGIFQNDKNPGIFQGMTVGQFASQGKARQVDAANLLGTTAEGQAKLAQIRDGLAKSATARDNLHPELVKKWGL